VTGEIITYPAIIGGNEEVAIYKPAKLTAESPVLFTLHGNWATRKRNEKYGEFFSGRGFLVVAPTYRYHDLEKQKDPVVLEKLGKTSTLDYVKDIEFLFDQLYCGKLIPDFIPATAPIVMGHSMGGLVAQVVASRRRVRGLITLNSAPPAGVGLHTDEDYKKRIKKLAGRIMGGKPYLPDLETYSLYVANGMPQEERAEIYKNALFESGTSSREILAGSGSGLVKMIACVFSRPIKIDGAKINCPVLVIGCEKDRIVPKEVAIDLWRKYNREIQNYCASLHIFPQFAHWVQYEPGWEASANYILEWLKDNVLN
jgi:pimeloyl-ACP methyl ester carboxylesterase